MADPCGINKIDSNVTGLSIAEEECLKRLPGVGGVDAVWYEQEPDAYADFGSETTSTVRAPISKSRQRRKGTITDIDASGGYTTDITFNNQTRMMQGFLFADVRQSASTAPIIGSKIAVTSVDATTDVYKAASGLTVFKPGMIVLASGFAVAGNNGRKTVVTAIAGEIAVDSPLFAEAAPPVGSKVECVGMTHAVGDLQLSFVGGVATLNATAADFTTYGLIPGKWVFIGDDAADGSFASFAGYARVSAISAKSLTLDKTTADIVTDAGAGKAVSLYWGSVVRNEGEPNLIKRRSYQLERRLGQDNAGEQSEYLIGAVANEMTINVPQTDKLNCDMTFVACDSETRDGLEGLKPGVRVNALGEDAINTSSDLYQIRMSIIDPTDPFPKALFGFVSEATISITNNAVPNKALGVSGAFDITVGDFEVSGSVTAYFTNVAATRAVRQNSDVDLYLIAAARNEGLIYDMPLIALGGGRITVEKDNPITVPLDTNAVESKFGNTLLAEYFPYLPNVAMPG